MGFALSPELVDLRDRAAEWRVVDRCVQILGGRGVTGEAIVMCIFSDMRALRIYNGPSEVHRWSIAKKFVNPVEGRPR